MAFVGVRGVGRGNCPARAHVRLATGGEGCLMLYIVGAILCVLLLLYLFAAMLKPEVF